MASLDPPSEPKSEASSSAAPSTSAAVPSASSIPTYRLSEGGVRANDGSFDRASLYRQALQLRYEGTPDDEEHPHALARVLFLLRTRLAELRSLPPRLWTTDPRAPRLLRRSGGGRPGSVAPLRKQISVLERAIGRMQAVSAAPGPGPGVRDYFSWEAIGSVLDFPGSEASDKQWEEARRQTSCGADADQAARAAALPRSFLLPRPTVEDGEATGAGPAGEEDEKHDEEEEDTDPYLYFADQSEADSDAGLRNSPA